MVVEAHSVSPRAELLADMPAHLAATSMRKAWPTFSFRSVEVLVTQPKV